MNSRYAENPRNPPRDNGLRENRRVEELPTCGPFSMGPRPDLVAPGLMAVLLRALRAFVVNPSCPSR